MSQTITYTLSVTITQPIDEDDNPEDYQTSRAKRDHEKYVHQTLEKTYGRGTVDCECMETEIKETS